VRERQFALPIAATPVAAAGAAAPSEIDVTAPEIFRSPREIA